MGGVILIGALADRQLTRRRTAAPRVPAAGAVAPAE
jgi:hypothetical protein